MQVLELGERRDSEELLRELEDIRLDDYKGYQQVQGSGSRLGLPGLSALAELLPELPQVESLHLRSNALPRDAGLIVAKLLVGTVRLRVLDLSENSLSDVGVASIAGAFTVDLSHLETGRTLSLLTLHTLNLSYNGFGDAAVLALCRGLAQFSRHSASLRRSPALRVLNLSGNKLGDKSAQCLGQLLVSLASRGGGGLALDELLLNNNPLSSAGMTALLAALSVDSLAATDSAALPPLKLLSMDQCYPNLSVLDAVGSCCLLQLRVHFTEADAVEALHSLHFADTLQRLYESLRANSFLTHLYLGHLPAALEAELRATETQDAELQRAYDLYLALADLLHVPLAVAEFSNKELRTPRHTDELPAASLPVPFDALQRQQREHEQLRMQHRSVFNKLADEIHKLQGEAEEDVASRDSTISSETERAQPAGRALEVEPAALHAIVRGAVEDALENSSRGGRRREESSVAAEDKTDKLLQRLERLERLLEGGGRQSPPGRGGQSDTVDSRLMVLEQRMDMVEYRIEELVAERARESPAPRQTVQLYGREVELPALAVDTALRLAELEHAVEVEHEFSLKLLDLLLNQQQHGASLKAIAGDSGGGESGARRENSNGISIVPNNRSASASKGRPSSAQRPGFRV